MKREKDRALFGSDSRPLGRGGFLKAFGSEHLVRDLSGVEDILKRLGLNIMVFSPLDHDRRMASPQAIVQFLGKAFLWGKGINSSEPFNTRI